MTVYCNVEHPNRPRLRLGGRRERCPEASPAAPRGAKCVPHAARTRRPNAHRCSLGFSHRSVHGPLAGRCCEWQNRRIRRVSRPGLVVSTGRKPKTNCFYLFVLFCFCLASKRSTGRIESIEGQMRTSKKTKKRHSNHTFVFHMQSPKHHGN